MAKPLPDQEERLKRICQDGLRIPSDVWELIRHHIGNDVHVIQLILELYTDSQGQLSVPAEHAQKLAERCQDIKEFLDLLRMVAIDGSRPAHNND